MLVVVVLLILVVTLFVVLPVSADAEAAAARAPAGQELADGARHATAAAASAHGERLRRPSSAVGRAAADILEQISFAEARAMQDAVAADALSEVGPRRRHGGGGTGGGSDSDDNAALDNGTPGFRSFSELYQWAVKAASTGSNGGHDRSEYTVEDRTQKHSRNNLPAVKERERPPIHASRHATQSDDDDDDGDDGDLHSPTCSARSGESEQGTCGSRAPGLIHDAAVDAAAASVASQTTRLQDLQRIADDLPEFEGEIVLLERAVAVLQPDKHASDDERIAALETIEDLCHSGDNGRDLHIIGGLALVVSLLDVAPPSASAISRVPDAAAKALATCSRNNPPVADAATDVLGAVPRLLDRASAHDASATARARALMALASLADAAPSARRACAANDARAAQLITAVSAALALQGAGTEENRAALRAFALAEAVARAEGSAGDTSERWKMRMLNSGVVHATRSVLENRNMYSEDAIEAAARLATVLGM